MQSAARSAYSVIPARAGIQFGRASIVRHLGLAEYAPTYQAMRRFADARGTKTPDELWVLEHPPVYTVGITGRAEHFPRSGEVPVERIDRGGQITYHGPGQAIVYALIDLARRSLTVRGMVSLIEQAVIEVVKRHAPDFDPATLGMRPSREGKYLSLTCNVRAVSREQLDDLYRELCDHPMVTMVL